MKSLESSIPANNEKIIEIYNKVKSGRLNPSPEFQRKLVWRKQHKINFIQTILLNYPFPEIYKAPGEMDVDKLELVDLIVDGQQRINTIINFIDGKDVFALPTIHMKFVDLSKEEKEKFLNYEISVRYLKNASKSQIIEIFQRINKTEYALNSMERTNAQWGDSEFVCFAKQIIEEELNIDTDLISYMFSQDDRQKFLKFFHGKEIFTENDNNRMLALQYILIIISTIVKGQYFRRLDDVQQYIELYNDEFESADEIKSKLLNVIEYVGKLEFDDNSYWLNKANLFTLLVELSKFDLSHLNTEEFKNSLEMMEEIYKKFATGNDVKEEADEDIIKYFEYSREAVNEKYAREHRGKVLEQMISNACL
jgi:hypothetical protein